MSGRRCSKVLRFTTKNVARPQICATKPICSECVGHTVQRISSCILFRPTQRVVATNTTSMVYPGWYLSPCAQQEHMSVSVVGEVKKVGCMSTSLLVETKTVGTPQFGAG